MNKIITTASLAALGACGLQAAGATGISAAQTGKPWSVSASLRGFYDDNYTTLPDTPTGPDGATAQDSFGFSVRPSIGYRSIGLEQTDVGVSYAYEMRYYEDRPDNTADHSHQFNANLNHRFSPRYSMEFSDTFAVFQEPEVGGGPVDTLLRSNGDNVRNRVDLSLSARLTELLSTVVGYHNGFYNYDNTGPNSHSALLDRWEHRANINLRWQAVEDTYGILGYQFEYVDHYSNDRLTIQPVAIAPGIAVMQTGIADFRDRRSHFGYVGVDHAFTPTLEGALRVGLQYAQYPEADNLSLFTPAVDPGFSDDDVIPYADGSFSWTYNPGSFVRLGIRHQKNATDISSTLDQDATTVYANLNHRFTARFSGNVMGQYQFGSYEIPGASDDPDDHYFIVGANVSYQINEFLSAETGYNYDRVDSDLPNRSFTRNRVYVGINAAY